MPVSNAETGGPNARCGGHRRAGSGELGGAHRHLPATAHPVSMHALLALPFTGRCLPIPRRDL